MSDWRDKRWEDRADRIYTDVTERPKRTAAKWLGGFIALILVFAVIGGVVSWVGSWGSEAARITSPDNVREQNTAIIEDWEAMQAAAANACGAESASQEAGDPTLIEDPALAYKATYRRIAKDYNRRMANLFEAQAVRNLPLPSNLRSYPQVAPTLEEAQQGIC